MKIRIVLLCLISLLLVAALIIVTLREPVSIKDKAQTVFVVNPGEGVSSIAKRLEQQGFIHNRFIFLFEVKRLGLVSKIQAGDFRLSRSETPAQIALDLTKGTLDVWIQIIEGLRAEEIAKLLQEKLPTYEDTWIGVLKKNEGYLFPDTYLIPKDADIKLIVKILRGNFDTKMQASQPDVGKNGLSLEDSIILASIVEREGLFDEDRPVIAGILLNRLKLGMALQADATVQYALGYQAAEKDWWKKNLTRADLAINSPYNTYKFPGLPPGPIANPGLVSLRAAFNPTDTDYLYYLHDKTGHTHYAKTLEEHNANIAKYLTL